MYQVCLEEPTAERRLDRHDGVPVQTVWRARGDAGGAVSVGVAVV